MTGVTVQIDTTSSTDVARLVQRHLEFAAATTPAPCVFALDLDGLTDPSVTLFSARQVGELLAIGALKELDATNGEVKSMHTAQSHRGAGLGRLMVEHVLLVAESRNYQRVSLETGSGPDFEAARSLYRGVGFTLSGPFANYPDVPSSTFMTITLPRSAPS